MHLIPFGFLTSFPHPFVHVLLSRLLLHAPLFTAGNHPNKLQWKSIFKYHSYEEKIRLIKKNGCNTL